MRPTTVFFLVAGLVGCGNGGEGADCGADCGGQASGGTSGSSGSGAGAGGSGTCDDGIPDTSRPLPGGCADITITPELVGPIGEWNLRLTALRGSAEIVGDRVVVAWVAYRFTDDGEHPILVVSAFSPDGELATQDLHDLFPASVTSNEAGLNAAFIRPDGALAVGHHWADEGVSSPGKLAIGEVGSANLDPVVDLEAAPSGLIERVQTAVGWDGEAFAVHAYRGTGTSFELDVARVDEAGEVVLPFTGYGETSYPDDNEIGHRTATVAETGRSYVFSAVGSPILSGHLRDATPLSGTESEPLLIEPNGVARHTSDLPALGANAEGVRVSWRQSSAGGYDNVVQRLDEDGASVGAALLVPPIDDVPEVKALVPRSDGGVLIAASSQKSMQIWRSDGAELGEHETLVELGEDPCFDTNDDGFPDVDMDIRDVHVFGPPGEEWVMFWEALGSFRSVIRVLKVAPGCIYGPGPALPQPE